MNELPPVSLAESRLPIPADATSQNSTASPATALDRPIKRVDKINMTVRKYGHRVHPYRKHSSPVRYTDPKCILLSKERAQIDEIEAKKKQKILYKQIITFAKEYLNRDYVIEIFMFDSLTSVFDVNDYDLLDRCSRVLESLSSDADKDIIFEPNFRALKENFPRIKRVLEKHDTYHKVEQLDSDELLEYCKSSKDAYRALISLLCFSIGTSDLQRLKDVNSPGYYSSVR